MYTKDTPANEHAQYLRDLTDPTLAASERESEAWVLAREHRREATLLRQDGEVRRAERGWACQE